VDHTVPSIIKERQCQKRPPLGTSGKLALAGTRKLVIARSQGSVILGSQSSPTVSPSLSRRGPNVPPVETLMVRHGPSS
jgi:hypothetical protein